MADFGALVSWTGIRTGRERKAMEVWAQALGFYEKAMENGDIEEYETIGFQSSPTGLLGAIMVRGDRTQIEVFVQSDAFVEQLQRAMIVAEGVSMSRFAIGAEMMRTVARYQGQLDDIGI